MGLERAPNSAAQRPVSLIHASVVNTWLLSLIRYRGIGLNITERRPYREDGHEPGENPRRHRYARLEPRDAFYLDHGNSPSRMPARSPNVRKRRPFQRKPRLDAVTQPGLSALVASLCIPVKPHHHITFVYHFPPHQRCSRRGRGVDGGCAPASKAGLEADILRQGLLFCRDNRRHAR